MDRNHTYICLWICLYKDSEKWLKLREYTTVFVCKQGKSLGTAQIIMPISYLNLEWLRPLCSLNYIQLAKVNLWGESLNINKMCFWLDNKTLVELFTWQSSNLSLSHTCCICLLYVVSFSHSHIYKR